MSVRAGAEPEWQPRAGVAVGTAAPGGTRLRAVLQIGHAHSAAPTGRTPLPSTDRDPEYWTLPNTKTRRALQVNVQNDDLKTFTKEAFVYAFAYDEETETASIMNSTQISKLKDDLSPYVNYDKDSPYQLVHKGADYNLGFEENVITEKMPSLKDKPYMWNPTLTKAIDKVIELLEEGQQNRDPASITILRDPSRYMVVSFNIEYKSNTMRNVGNDAFYLSRGDDDEFKLYDKEKKRLFEVIKAATATKRLKNHGTITIGIEDPDWENRSNVIASRAKNEEWNVTYEKLEKAFEYIESEANNGQAIAFIYFYNETSVPSDDPDFQFWNSRNTDGKRALRVYVQNKNLETFTKRAFEYTVFPERTGEGVFMPRIVYSKMVEDLQPYISSDLKYSPYKLVHKGANYNFGYEENVLTEKMPSRNQWTPAPYWVYQELEKLLVARKVNEEPLSIRILRDPSRYVVVAFKIEDEFNLMRQVRTDAFYLFRGDDDMFKLYDEEKERLFDVIKNMTMDDVNTHGMITIGFQGRDAYGSNVIAFRAPNQKWDVTYKELEKAFAYIEGEANRKSRSAVINFYNKNS